MREIRYYGELPGITGLHMHIMIVHCMCNSSIHWMNAFMHCIKSSHVSRKSESFSSKTNAFESTKCGQHRSVV
jgi:hypothetical protein